MHAGPVGCMHPTAGARMRAPEQPQRRPAWAPASAGLRYGSIPALTSSSAGGSMRWPALRWFRRARAGFAFADAEIAASESAVGLLVDWGQAW